MKKEVIRGGGLLLILLLVYLSVAIIVPFVHNAVFYNGIGFTLLAFVLAGAGVYAGFAKHPGVRSKFYGFPIVRIAGTYLVLQIAVSLIFMALGKWIPAWVTILVYAAALLASAIGMISADTVAEEIREMDSQLKKDVTLMRCLQSKVLQMKNQCEDVEANRSVSGLAESLRYSDPVSNEAIQDAERDLSAAIDELQAAVVDGDNDAVKQLCRKAKGLLDERNRLCKLNK